MLMLFAYAEDADLRKVADAFPLLPNVLLVSNEHNVPQFLLLEVARSQRHDEVPQPDNGRVGVRKKADDNVVAKHRHGSLLPRLKPWQPLPYKTGM